MPTPTTRGYPVPNLTGDGSDVHQMFLDGLTAVDADMSAVEAAAQPLDSDLTAIAALTTTAYGRSLLELADAAAGRTALAAAAGADLASLLATPRMLAEGSGNLIAADTVGVYVLRDYGDQHLTKTAVAATGMPPLVRINAAEHPTIAGKVAKLVLEILVAGNANVGAVATFQANLYSITSIAGAGNPVVTLNASVGDTSAGLTGAGSPGRKLGSEFALPTDGIYCLAITLAGATLPASAYIGVAARLYVQRT
jgi:hypothetical protein